MTVRWRLSVLALQLGVLAAATYLVVGKPYSADTWFIAGLLAIAINPELLEPYYPRPADVVANSVVFFVIFLTTKRAATAQGWYVVAAVVGLFFALGVTALVLGAGRNRGRLVGPARAARKVSQLGSARFIYSAVFFLSALESDPSFSLHFWFLVSAWVAIMGLGQVNWQSILLAAPGRPTAATAEGMIGPSSVLVSAPAMPPPGTAIELTTGRIVGRGVVISRIRRREDVWGQIHVADCQLCERILEGQSILFRACDEGEVEGREVVGAVAEGSTDRLLQFTATCPLEVGQVVTVPLPEAPHRITYQLSSGHVRRLEVKGGAHLVVDAKANQLGIFDPGTLRFRSHRWVPSPGALVYKGSEAPALAEELLLPNFLRLGCVIGTSIPVFLDLAAACEGHLAILGMTKMGKSTLAERIARQLAQSRRVTILDQTGEYVAKKGLAACGMDVDWASPGISVFEPKPGEVPPKRALDFLNYLVDQAVKEYKVGQPAARSVIFDEAHQFIPEPAGLGFTAPGREQSYAIGLLMMQIRKYGISVILISQRTAVVAKSALSQCENLIAFRSVDQTGLDYLEAVAGAEVRNLLPQLRQGEAVVFGPAISSDTPIAIRVAQGELPEAGVV